MIARAIRGEVTEQARVALGAIAEIGGDLRQDRRAAARQQLGVDHLVRALPQLAFLRADLEHLRDLLRAMQRQYHPLLPRLAAALDRERQRKLVDAMVRADEIVVVIERYRRDPVALLQLVHDQSGARQQQDRFADWAVPDLVELREQVDLQPLVRQEYAADDVAAQPERGGVRRAHAHVYWRLHAWRGEGCNGRDTGRHVVRRCWLARC